MAWSLLNQRMDFVPKARNKTERFSFTPAITRTGLLFFAIGKLIYQDITRRRTPANHNAKLSNLHLYE